MAVAVITFIVFMERAQRRLVVQFPKRQVGMRVTSGEMSHLPLKLNSSGVIPPIFASSLLLLPLTFVNFGGTDKGGDFVQWLARNLGHGTPLYLAFYVGLIVFFAFFYTAVVFNPVDTADNLKKNGGFIPGYRPGKNTAEYLDYVLTRLTVVGAAYLAVRLPPAGAADRLEAFLLLLRRDQPPDRRLRHDGYGRADPLAPSRSPV